MAVIDPNGLFKGDRLTACSDEARLFWPYYVAASNNFGRLELNIQLIIKTAFGTFKQPPSEEMVTAHLQEYRDNFLLFVYLADGQGWGQWDIPQEYLKRHKTAEDRRSPDPPADLLQEWKAEYLRRKTARLGALANLLENAPTCAQTRTNTPRRAAQVRGVGVGVGVGGGEGIGQGIPETDQSEDGEAQTYAIFRLHPRNVELVKAGKRCPEDQARMIFEAILEDGYELVLAGVRNLADAFAKRPPSDITFCPPPLKFFRPNSEGNYLAEPIRWQGKEQPKAVPMSSSQSFAARNAQ